MNSFGIILFMIKHNSIYFLIIKKRLSIAFIHLFILNGCETENDEKKYINLLPSNERQMILSLSYDEIYDYVKLNLQINTMKYFIERKKYISIVNKYKHILSNFSTSKNSYYEFPKGRKYKNETMIDCAVRECCEEVNFTKSDINIVSSNPYIYSYIGHDGNIYKNTFFIGYIKPPKCYDDIVYTKYKNFYYLSNEVECASWCLLYQCLNKLSYNDKKILEKVYNKINKKINLLN